MGSFVMLTLLPIQSRKQKGRASLKQTEQTKFSILKTFLNLCLNASYESTMILYI